MLLRSKISQVSKIVVQRIAVFALQRVVVDHIFHIIDEAIKLTFIEMTLA